MLNIEKNIKLLKQIIQANWKRLWNIKVEPEEYRLSICAKCPINDNGICSKERGGCGCPIKSKVKCLDCNCPTGRWKAVKKD